MNFTKNSRIKIQKCLNPHKQNLKITPLATKNSTFEKALLVKI